MIIKVHDVEISFNRLHSKFCVQFPNRNTHNPVNKWSSQLRTFVIDNVIDCCRLYQSTNHILAAMNADYTQSHHFNRHTTRAQSRAGPLPAFIPITSPTGKWNALVHHFAFSPVNAHDTILRPLKLSSTWNILII